ncbi:MAG: DUF167 domain-containing protein [Candidatus Eisenbacteria bacterium]
MKLSLRVQPGAKRSALLARLASGEWKVAVAAPPVEGKANVAVLDLMCELLGLKRRQVSVTRGAASRSKTLEIEGITEADAEARLVAALAPEALDPGTGNKKPSHKRRKP